MHHRKGRTIPILCVAALGAAGCDHSLDSIDGYHMGEPASVVYGLSPQSRMMIVMSDLPSLCADLQSSEAPSDSNFWVMSLWTGSATEAEGVYGAEVFAAFTRGGVTEEYSTTRADLDIDKFDIDGDEMEFSVDIVFDETGDRVRASLIGDVCDARYFQGLE